MFPNPDSATRGVASGSCRRMSAQHRPVLGRCVVAGGLAPGCIGANLEAGIVRHRRGEPPPRPRRLRQHRQEPAAPRRALPRPRGAATPPRGARPPPGRTPPARGGASPAHPHSGRGFPKSSTSSRTKSASCPKTARAPASAIPGPAAHPVVRAGSGAAARGAATSRGRGPRVPRGPPRRRGSTPSGAASARRRDCPAFASTTRATPGPRGGAMNGVGLTTMGRLLGHRKRRHLRSPGRRCLAGRRRAGRRRHRAGDGLQGRSAAAPGRGGPRGWPDPPPQLPRPAAWAYRECPRSCGPDTRGRTRPDPNAAAESVPDSHKPSLLVGLRGNRDTGTTTVRSRIALRNGTPGDALRPPVLDRTNVREVQYVPSSSDAIVRGSGCRIEHNRNCWSRR